VTSGPYDYYLVNDNGSNRLLVSNNGTTISRIVAGQSSWTNYSYQAILNIDSSSTGSASLLARVQDNSHLYFFGYNIYLGEWMIAKKNGTATNILATSSPYTVYGNQDYTVQANLSGNSLKLFVGGVLVVSTTDTSYASGKIGFSGTDAVAELGNVVVTQLNGGQALGHSTSSPVQTLSAPLSGGMGAAGHALFTVNAAAEQNAFTLQVVGLPGSTFSVDVGHTTIGQLSTDANGNGQLELKDLPAILAAGSRIKVVDSEGDTVLEGGFATRGDNLQGSQAWDLNG